MRIIIDAMGGDHAPHSVIEGTLSFLSENNDTTIILVGDEVVLKPLVPVGIGNIEIVHAPEKINGEDEPVHAVKKKKDSSLVVAVNLLKNGMGDALISAGNTGAFMAAGTLILGRASGIERPALAAVLPTVDGRGVLALDMGANISPTSAQLIQYAQIGNDYAKLVHGIENPKIGLLNVGTEEKKGTEMIKEVHQMLVSSSLNFIGNVEARDVPFGGCDVLVCDGFSGNVLLKTMEGTAEAIFSLLKEQFTKNLLNKIAASILLPSLKKMKKNLDYTESGGAPLLGLQKACVKAHGSSNGTAIKNAISQATRFSKVFS